MNFPDTSVIHRATETYARTVFTLSDLIASGTSRRQVAAMVRRGHLIHVRRDRYALPLTDTGILEAVRIGGRLTCLSLLTLLGVFVHDCDELHVLMTPGTSRLRAPRSTRVVSHWTTNSARQPHLHIAQLADAVAHAVRCQAPRQALATVDSVVHHRLMSLTQLTAVFAALPARYRPLLSLVDASSASGPETYMRLILRAMGVPFATQVHIETVGRVDFLVDGWLIIECDSRRFHQGWEKQVDDRRRDIAAARLGYITVRPLAQDILGDHAGVREVFEQIIEAFGPRLAPSGRARFSKKSS
ncbi:type IV toxin-antitoxin system AbiEi family antitoxin domain-containing protein [Microbacterium sp. 3J1]|uniref:type IV toxin-antitoxin system AbiEi family antitoxin domain-containing protein n=1 Tax=Microbacterium sp. 3J1 TaxID=861269 RepID=UPI000AC2E210|nr:type IV toxin-antitoxin system AbiEi family antitoxin domain-containing protein [Microbacterium sp. 3J1]